MGSRKWTNTLARVLWFWMGGNIVPFMGCKIYGGPIELLGEGDDGS